jgi:hypothetical protein
MKNKMNELNLRIEEIVLDDHPALAATLEHNGFQRRIESFVWEDDPGRLRAIRVFIDVVTGSPPPNIYVFVNDHNGPHLEISPNYPEMEADYLKFNDWCQSAQALFNITQPESLGFYQGEGGLSHEEVS